MQNPMQMILMFQQLSSTQNPMQSMIGMMGGQSNPMVARAMEMMDGKGEDQMKEVVKNICKQKGIDFSMIEQMLPKK